MQIGIHAAALVRPRIAGVERYTRELLGALLALPESRSHTFVLFTPTRPDFDVSQTPHAKFHIVPQNIAFTQFGLSKAFLRMKLDSFFVPAHVLPRVLPGKTVVTVHGLEFEHAPWAYPKTQRLWLRVMTKDAVKRADKVIAISEATKRDLVERYHVPEDKISVIHHGFSVQETQDEIASKAQVGRKPYFLFFGRLEQKKNIASIVRAFTTFKTLTRFPHRLLLAGAAGFGFSHIKKEVDTSPAKNDIVRLGYVPDTLRGHLLKYAAAFVFPSWAEGFGLPILEAQAAGVPVITSDTTAMPEIAGGGALFVDPKDPEMLAQAMRKIVQDPKLRQKLIVAGLVNLKRFSWEETARRTLGILIE